MKAEELTMLSQQADRNMKEKEMIRKTPVGEAVRRGQADFWVAFPQAD